MLILSRKQGERVVMDNGVVVLVVSMRGSQVRLGIEAPQAVKVMREELLPSPADAADGPVPPPRPRRLQRKG